MTHFISMKDSDLRYWFVVFCVVSVCICNNGFSQVSKTIIKGTVVDADTKEPLIGAAVVMENSTIGTLTDILGRYIISTDAPVYKIKFSYLGYQTISLIFTPGKTQTVNVQLKSSNVRLGEVEVRPVKKKYKNKDNPAVDLVGKIISNKSMNKKENLDYLSYNKYEKLTFIVSNLDDNFVKSRAFEDFKFIFDNSDTTIHEKNNLPFFIKEKVSTTYFRKDPKSEKEKIHAEKTINFDEYVDTKGIRSTLDYYYQNINIYDDEIFFLTNRFLSPTASTAATFYKYFIIDTSLVDTTRCIKLFFEPRNPADFLFHGFLYITNDTTYAIKKIDMSFNRAINIDWVKDARIIQNFERVGEKVWMISEDEVIIDFAVTNNLPGLKGKRVTTYSDYSVNKKPDDSLFKGLDKEHDINSSTRDALYWSSIRNPDLTTTEKNIYTIVDSVKKVPDFRRKMGILVLLSTDFLKLKKVEIGPVNNFYSYNPVEGSRVRFGGRTTEKFNNKFYLESYVAYGFNDDQIKYNLTTTYSLNGKSLYRFPVKTFRAGYSYDTQIPGQELQYTTGDNFLFSFKRGIDDKMFYNRSYFLEARNEFENHFSYTAGYNFTKQTPGGNLFFYNNIESADPLAEIPHINEGEFYAKLRYAPKEEFVQGTINRYPVPSANPVFQVQYAMGSEKIGNDYNYKKIKAGISKRFYMSIIGYTDVSVEAGKLFGTVPYPLLFIHNANQSYSYEKYSYNMMNFLEFVSDQ
jgi:hypothetical protein